MIEEIWGHVTYIFNVTEEAKHILPEIKAFYTTESLVDTNFIVGSARSILPFTWNISSLRLALVEFTRPFILVNPYVHSNPHNEKASAPHISACPRTKPYSVCSSCWHGLELELLYRASCNERLVHELPCLWSYPLIATLASQWIKVEELFEAPALWSEEILLEELGFDKSIIERRIKVCSIIRK